MTVQLRLQTFDLALQQAGDLSGRGGRRWAIVSGGGGVDQGGEGVGLPPFQEVLQCLDLVEGTEHKQHKGEETGSLMVLRLFKSASEADILFFYVLSLIYASP